MEESYTRCLSRASQRRAAGTRGRGEQRESQRHPPPPPVWSFLSNFGKFADLRTGQNWTFGVPNDLFCLSVGSAIIADCGAPPSGGAKAFNDGQRSGASGDPAPGRACYADERSPDQGFRVSGLAHTPAGRVFTPLTSVATVPGLAHTPAGRVFTPLTSVAKQFQEHTPRKAKREEGERESC